MAFCHRVVNRTPTTEMGNLFIFYMFLFVADDSAEIMKEKTTNKQLYPINHPLFVVRSNPLIYISEI